MSLDIVKLENAERNGVRITARCPACAEHGHDNKGNHLSIDEHGRFSCVVNPGEYGDEHRKRIYALVGKGDGATSTSSVQQDKTIKIKPVNKNTGFALKKNILGHLGRVNQTHAYKEKDNKDNIYKVDIEKDVPTVPNTEDEPVYTLDEMKKLTAVSKEALNAINMIKSYFSESKVVDVQTNKSMASTDDSEDTCARCGSSRGERFCFGETKLGKHVWGRFCLECYPYHF